MTTATDLLQSVKIRVGMLADSRVSGFDVEVEVDNGVARLTGNVETDEQRIAAEEVASTVEGVVEVENEIVVTPYREPVEYPEEPTLAGFPGMVGSSQAPAAYGGPAPGVFTVLSPERAASVTDEELLNRVRDAIIMKDAIESRDIDIHTDGGVVYLHGKVRSFDEFSIVEEIVATIPGVRDVRNNIEIKEAGCRECNEW